MRVIVTFLGDKIKSMVLALALEKGFKILGSVTSTATRAAKFLSVMRIRICIKKSDPDPYGEIQIRIRIQDIYGKCAETSNGK